MTDGPFPPPANSVPAATILLLRDDPLQVLMVQRRAGQVFGSALVFPGGVVDESDRSDAWLPLIDNIAGDDVEARALCIAGFRETFEETGILLARGTDGRCVAHPRDSGAFIDIVRASGGRLVLSDLVRFGHWVTPSLSPKRFDTHFFLAHLSEPQEAICDGDEAVALEWAVPADILARAAAGETAILFPTRMNIARLAEHDDAASALRDWRGRAIFTVHPRVERRENGMVVTIPAEAGYPETMNFHPAASPRT